MPPSASLGKPGTQAPPEELFRRTQQFNSLLHEEKQGGKQVFYQNINNNAYQTHDGRMEQHQYDAVDDQSRASDATQPLEQD